MAKRSPGECEVFERPEVAKKPRAGDVAASTDARAASEGEAKWAEKTRLLEAKSTESAATWCQQIEGLTEEQARLLVNWVQENEYIGQSLLLISEEDLQTSNLKAGPRKLVLEALKGEGTKDVDKVTLPEWFNDVLTAKVEGMWFGEGTNIPHAPIYVRPCYVKMKGLLFDMKSLEQKERLTYVVKGTPGIGKTTMLFYLLWECTQKESPYTAVLFATNKDNFVARKTSAGCWAMEPFNPDSAVSGCGNAKAIGLVDVNPEGEVKRKGRVIMGFNTQAPCAEFGLHRLVVVSSAGAQLSQLIGKTGDRFAPEVLYLPVWKAEQTHEWVRKCQSPAIQQRKEIEANAGWAVPRLIELYLQSKFAQTLDLFIHRIAGTNTAGKESSAKDAHTMVLLRGSSELMEDVPSACPTGRDDEFPSILPTFQHGGEAGSEIGLASPEVEQRMCALRHDKTAMIEMIRLFPKAVAYVFEGLVLDRLVHKDGLQLNGKDDAQMLTLRFSERCELWGAKTIKDGVLYRPRGDDYPAIDACGVPASEAPRVSPRFVFIQVTTGRDHRRVQENLVETVRIPKTCTGGVLCLYIVPSAPSSLTLTSGANALKEGAKKGGKQVSEIVVAASSVLKDLPDDVRQKFEPGMKH